MNDQKQTFKNSSIRSEIDLLTTDDRALIELSRSIIAEIETKEIKIIDLSHITPDHRFIRVEFPG